MQDVICEGSARHIVSDVSTDECDEYGHLNRAKSSMV